MLRICTWESVNICIYVCDLVEDIHSDLLPACSAETLITRPHSGSPRGR
jgi:hypothetical protein